MKSKMRAFLALVVPSVLSFTLSGVYVIVDGFFVGNSVGDIGLSTINVAYPVVSLIQSLGVGIGMGGAVLYSIHAAMGEEEKSRSYMHATIDLLLLSAVAVTVLLTLLLTPVLRLLGAQGELLAMGRQYLRIIVLGAVFQIFGVGLLPVIRNHDGASYAMAIMIAGFVTNIALDYVFVWVLSWALAGAAAATVIGQAVTMAGGFAFLLRKKLPAGRFSAAETALFGEIARLGVAPFGLNLSPIVSLVLINTFSMANGGEPAVACYACVSYVMTILYYFIQGVGDGSQPLMSQYFGAGDRKSVRQIRGMAFAFAELLTVLGALVLFFGRRQVGLLFGASAEVAAMAADAMPVFLLGALVLPFARITTSGFYATANSLFSYILVYMEPLLLLVLLLILPRFGGQSCVWWSMAGAQILTAAIALALMAYADRKPAQTEKTS